jgi:hypothetical protein
MVLFASNAIGENPQEADDQTDKPWKAPVESHPGNERGNSDDAKTEAPDVSAPKAGTEPHQIAVTAEAKESSSKPTASAMLHTTIPQTSVSPYHTKPSLAAKIDRNENSKSKSKSRSKSQQSHTKQGKTPQKGGKKSKSKKTGSLMAKPGVHTGKSSTVRSYTSTAFVGAAVVFAVGVALGFARKNTPAFISPNTMTLQEDYVIPSYGTCS